MKSFQVLACALVVLFSMPAAAEGEAAGRDVSSGVYEPADSGSE